MTSLKIKTGLTLKKEIDVNSCYLGVNMNYCLMYQSIKKCYLFMLTGRQLSFLHFKNSC